jgi:hypothetical protein
LEVHLILGKGYAQARKALRRREPATLRAQVLPFQHDGQNTCGFTETNVKPSAQNIPLSEL